MTPDEEAQRERMASDLHFMESRISAEVEHLRDLFDERDRRYSQKFKDQEKATVLRANQLGSEFHEHLTQVKQENALALRANEKTSDAALAAQQLAIGKAETANEKRLDSINEFRGQLNDVITTLMPRTEAVARADGNAARIAELTTTVAAMLSRSEAEALISRSGERLQELTDRLNRSEGQEKGVAQSWSIIFAVIGAVGTLIGIATAIIVFSR